MQPWADPDAGAATSGTSGRLAGPRVGVLRPRPAAARSTLRPLATFEIVDQATAFWRRRLGAVVAVTLIATVPVQVLGAIACRAEVACGGSGTIGWIAALADGRYDVIVLLLLALATLLAGQLAAAAVVQLVVADRLGGPVPPVRRALAVGLRRLWAVIVAWAVAHVILLVGATAAVGPLVVMALTLVATPVVVVEGTGPLRGLRRAAQLGRRRFWPMLGVSVASGLVALALALALALLPVLLGLLEPLKPWEWLLRAAATQLQLLVSVPLAASAATLAYLDVRVRVEGLDLQIDADRAFAGAAVPGLAGAVGAMGEGAPDALAG